MCGARRARARASQPEEPTARPVRRAAPAVTAIAPTQAVLELEQLCEEVTRPGSAPLLAPRSGAGRR
jgi:hypothetical protein